MESVCCNCYLQPLLACLLNEWRITYASNFLTTPPEDRARSMSKVRMMAVAIAFNDNLFTKPKQETPDHHSRDDYFRLASGSCVSLASRVDGNNLVTVPRLALASPEAFFKIPGCSRFERPSTANAKARTRFMTPSLAPRGNREPDGLLQRAFHIPEHDELRWLEGCDTACGNRGSNQPRTPTVIIQAQR